MRFSAFFLIFFFIGFESVSQAAEWKKISDDDGITVFQKADEQGTGVSFRGETNIPASIESILTIMKNNSLAHEWMPLVVSRKDLKSISQNERIEYTHVGMPWPLTDRYFINRARADQLENGQMKIFVQSVETPEPQWLEKDKVLGFLYYSEFLLTPLEGGAKTHMVIEVNSDPKGLIPKFLVNAAQKSWPIKFFTGLTQMLVKAGLTTEGAVAH